MFTPHNDKITLNTNKRLQIEVANLGVTVVPRVRF